MFTVSLVFHTPMEVQNRLASSRAVDLGMAVGLDRTVAAELWSAVPPWDNHRVAEPLPRQLAVETWEMKRRTKLATK